MQSTPGHANCPSRGTTTDPPFLPAGKSGRRLRSCHVRRRARTGRSFNDPQLRANNIVVPLEGAGGKLTSTISSPINVHGVAKVPAKRAPALGEHNEAVLKELGFSTSEIDGLHESGVVSKAKERAA